MTETNPTVIITGGANGIGKASVRAFANANYRVLIADLDIKQGEQLAKELCSKGHEVLFQETDIGTESSIRQMVQKAISHWGVVNALVNCAACFIMKGIDASTEDWEACLRINVIGYATCSKYVVPFMTSPRGGSIINISSISALIAQPEFVTYSAAKGAVSSMTRCMALDLASRKIRVNAICPGTVWTESNEKFTMLHRGLDRKMANNDSEMGGKHILQRVADPEEIASVVLFLASDASSFITGSNMLVDGGYTAL